MNINSTICQQFFLPMSALLAAIGMIFGIIGVLLMLILISKIFPSKRHPNFIHDSYQVQITNRHETASWLNIIFARMNSSSIDHTIIDTACKELTQSILNDPDRPQALTEIRIAPLNKPTQSPLFTDFVISSHDNFSSLSLYVQYQGSPSFSVFCSSSGGPSDIPKLFTITLNLEFILKLLVAKLLISFDNQNENALIHIGNDLIVELNFKPLFENQDIANQQYIQSISSWISNFILRKLRGKTFPLYTSDNNDNLNIESVNQSFNNFSCDSFRRRNHRSQSDDFMT